jgi:uncharacterized protein (TIGR02996 family)
VPDPSLPPDLLASVARDPYDDAPRLVLADWLEERGDAARAEFVRVQLELEPVRDRYELPRAAELHQRELELLREHWDAWRSPLPAGFGDWRLGATVELHRGLVDTAAMPARTFLALGAELRAHHPALRRVVLFRVQGYGERLADCPALEGLPELELACWYSDDDARAIAASPHLRSLQVLELWMDRWARLSDTRLCKIMGSMGSMGSMAGSGAWPRLRELSLLHPQGKQKKKLVAEADRAAGRAIAVARSGYPDRFPFAPDIGRGLYPGRLPDGRAAVGLEGGGRVEVITFDRAGRQTREVLDLALPETLRDPAEPWASAHEEGVRRHLAEHLGMVPAFVRIRHARFPSDLHGAFCPQRGHEDDWERLGLPDDDGEASWEEEPVGHGGKISWLVREGQYELAWEWWADKRGRVHTT